MSFASLKKSRKNTSVDALVEKAKEISGKGEKKNYKDDRFWKPTVDKEGNGFCVIRFLPSKVEGELPWVRYWDHFFQGPTGQYYVEKSLTSIGQTDPLGEENQRIWNLAEANKDKTLKDIVRSRKRKLHYITNILVVNDPKNPENNGKVFLYDFGKKIMDKLMDALQPKFEGETPIVPYDFWEGADFELKMFQNDGGFRDYSSSAFKSPSALFDGDDSKLEEVYDKLYALNEFIDPDNYKSYDQLKTRLQIVLGQTTGGTEKQEQAREDLSKTEEPNVGKTEESKTPASADELDDGEDEDALSYFANLAKDD